MKDKIKDALEVQWIPAIATTVIILVAMIACCNWTVSRIDQQSLRIDQQVARTDRLYEMFIDLLKKKR